MIKVDLTKDQAERESAPLQMKKESSGSNVLNLVVLILGVAIAYAAHLAIHEFHKYLGRQHAAHMTELRQSVANVEADILKLAPFKKELESYDTQKKQVQDRIEAIQALIQNREVSVSALDAVGQNLPPKSWLHRVDLTMGTTNKLKMEGLAFNNEEVSDFVDRLSETIYFQDVRLDQTVPAIYDDTDMRAFSITAIPKTAQARDVAHTDKPEAGGKR